MKRVANLTAMVVLAVLCGIPGQSQTPGIAGAQPKRNLYVVATAHLDTQWRWTIQNTINEYVPSTFRENFKLMDRFPDYTFSFEGAFKYMLLKEYYPKEFGKLKTYIANGRWRLAGSWVDAVDVNMPSFESLVRQTLYGNGYYKKEFGKTSRDVLLPDCFGFGYALPSIAAHCGLKSFSTQKLSWGSSVGIPFEIGLWEGVDGSTLVSALNPGSYGTQIRTDLSRDTTWKARIDKEGDTSGLYADYMYFGTGDIGGSPDSESVAWLEKSIRSDGPLKVHSIGSDDLVDIVDSAKGVNLPRYKGELLMKRHGIGCYSSQAAMKRWNRKNELLADAAERASVIASLNSALPYPRQTLKDTWIRFLWHQFHDDLTGTSIPEAYEFSWNDEILCLNRFAGILENAVAATSPALDTRAKGVPLIVYNPLSIAREDVVEATINFGSRAPKYVRVYNPKGKEVPSQIAESYPDSLRILFLAEVPSVGYAVYDVRSSDKPCRMKTGLQVNDRMLQNERYTVHLNSSGDVASLTDRTANRQVLEEPITLQLLHDKPTNWPAWEIQYDDIVDPPIALVGGIAAVKIVENGPARVALEVTRKTDKSTIRQIIRLSAGGAGGRLEFDNDLNWYERERLLKAVFKFDTKSEKVTYGLALGTSERGLNRPELYEVPGHQWADMTSKSGDYGVAVLNDCKYGWDHPDTNTLRLTLIHTPGVFEDWSWVQDERSQDNGHHQFKYALQAHDGNWSEAGIPWAAARLNQSLLAFQSVAHTGAIGKSFSLASAGNVSESKSAGTELPQVMINAVKFAEDGNDIVIRVRELQGKDAKALKLSLARPIASAREINGVEDNIGPAYVRDGVLYFSLTPYQPKAFAVTLTANLMAKHILPQYQIVQLPFDLDGVSSDDKKNDGDFDGNGITIAAELLPDTIYYNAIPFATGPKAAGNNNVLKCGGQSLQIPAGAYNQLFLICTAVGGPQNGTFTIGGNKIDTWVQDFSENLGQWNNRLVGGQFLEEPDQISPAYINRAPIAWVGTHRHNGAEENEAYKYTYLYAIKLNVPSGAQQLILPNNPNIRLLAATAVKSNDDNIIPVQPLYDYTNTTLTNIFAARSSFVDDLEFTMSSPIPGAKIHYTLDGSEPGENSPAYAGPVTVRATTTVKARALLPGADDSHVTSVVFKKLIPIASVKVGKSAPGLECTYYLGEWEKLPNFANLTPEKKTITTTIGIPGYVRKEDFGLVLTGYIDIPRDGLYDFYLSSDDGSRLYIGDSLLIDNDGIHGADEVSEEIALAAGPHKITIQMFQAKGYVGLGLSFKGPGIDKQTIPPNMLFNTTPPGKR